MAVSSRHASSSTSSWRHARRLRPVLRTTSLLGVLSLSVGNVVSTFAVSSPDVCILPIGNSITQADSDHDSWRYPLWKMLVDAEGTNLTIDFVGSMTTHFGGARSFADYRGKQFPQRHEGHWGWRADQLLTSLPAWLDGYDSANQCVPTCVLMHLGTNDVWQGGVSSILGTLDEMWQIVDLIRTQYISVSFVPQFLIAKPIPSCSVTEVTALGAAIGEEVDELIFSANVSDLHLVDMVIGFNVSAMTYDNCHPNAAGEEFMANRWAEAVIQHCIAPEPAGINGSFNNNGADLITSSTSADGHSSETNVFLFFSAILIGSLAVLY